MDQLYKDERTGQLWKGINKRGNYIDMERISDKLILSTLHSVGHFNIDGKNSYKNKTSWVKFQFKTVFNPYKECTLQEMLQA